MYLSCKLPSTKNIGFAVLAYFGSPTLLDSLFHRLTMVLVDRIIAEVGAKPSEHLCILFPVLLTFLKDNNPVVVKQSIITGTKIFSSVLEELALQVSLSLSACVSKQVCVHLCSLGWNCVFGHLCQSKFMSLISLSASVAL